MIFTKYEFIRTYEIVMLLHISNILKKYKDIEIELLLAHVLNKPKEFLFMNPDHRLTRNQMDRLTRMVNRREKCEPIAYILGYKDFLDLRFKVNKNVLIPRPETENLVESIKLKVESLGQKNIKILDVGTGSGCIAITLARMINDLGFKAQITASDISKKALVVAKQNAKIILNKSHYHTREYDSEIKFVKSNLLKNIKEDFNIVVANLPYGWKAWKNNTSALTTGLKFEPQNALFTQQKGLELIRELLEQSAKRKILPQLIYLEFDPRQKQDLSKLIKKIFPNSKAVFYKDYASLWRFVEINI